MSATTRSKLRIDWVDYAKGICIILVVMMHSTLGVEEAIGAPSWLNGFIAWARPFRMPDFFLISGLFLASRIDRPWRTYADTKVLHFAYFYALWMTIQFVVKYPAIAADQGGTGGALGFFALSFIEPFGTLWFIYLLAAFFVAVKVLHRVNPAVIWLTAAGLEAAHVDSGWLVVDEFAARFVYFYSGYLFASRIFALARRFDAMSAAVLLAGLVIWGVANAMAVEAGYDRLPGISLALGFVGAMAVVACGGLLGRAGMFSFVRHCGENSIVIYLSFFLFMAATRLTMLKAGLIADAGLTALVVTAAGVAGPLLLHRVVRNTPARFLFSRPAGLRLPAARPAFSGHAVAADRHAAGE